MKINGRKIRSKSMRRRKTLTRIINKFKLEFKQTKQSSLCTHTIINKDGIKTDTLEKVDSLYNNNVYRCRICGCEYIL